MSRTPLLKIQRAAAMGEPAHDQLVLTNELLAIDAQVLPFLMRTASNRQSPGNQRGSIFWPAGHDRDTRQINVVAFNDLLLAGCSAQALCRHIQDLPELRQLIEQIAKAFRRFRLFQKSQQLTHFTQRADILLPHSHGDAARSAKQIAQHGHGVAFGVFKKQGRAAGT